MRVTALFGGAALIMTAAFTGTASAAQPRPTQDPIQAMAEACHEGWLCVWDEGGGHGNRHDFYECLPEDVRAHGLARVGSYVNNQTDGTVATFKGPDAANPNGPWFDQ